LCAAVFNALENVIIHQFYQVGSLGLNTLWQRECLFEFRVSFLICIVELCVWSERIIVDLSHLDTDICHIDTRRRLDTDNKLLVIDKETLDHRRVEFLQGLVLVLGGKWCKLSTDEVVRCADLLNKCHCLLIARADCFDLVLSKEGEFGWRPEHVFFAVGIVAAPCKNFAFSPHDEVIKSTLYLINLSKLESKVDSTHLQRLPHVFTLTQEPKPRITNRHQLHKAIIASKQRQHHHKSRRLRPGDPHLFSLGNEHFLRFDHCDGLLLIRLLSRLRNVFILAVAGLVQVFNFYLLEIYRVFLSGLC